MSFPIRWDESPTDVVVDSVGGVGLNGWTLLVAASPDTSTAILQNKSASIPVFITNDPSNTDGFEIAPKGAFNMDGIISAWYGKTASSTAPVHVGVGTDK